MSVDVMASMKDIAETAGCSVSTVSRVLKNKGEIAPATRKKILAIAEKFGYHDNRLIYGIRTGHTQTIGLVCDFSNLFFQRIASAIEQEMRKRDYLVIFCSQPEEDDQKTLKRLVEQRVDGVILVPRNDFADTEYFRDVISRGLPIITIDRKTPANVDYIGSDDLLCGRLMAEHFHLLGHRRIAYYAGPPYASPAQLRLQGFADFCREHPEISLTILRGSEVNGCDPEEEMLTRFLKKHREITAIDTFYDYFAYDVCRAALKLGRRIPEDLAVAGVGDMVPERARMFELTSIDQQPEKIAEAAARRMLARLALNRDETLTPVEIRIEPRLVIRNSTIKERAVRT